MCPTTQFGPAELVDLVAFLCLTTCLSTWLVVHPTHVWIFGAACPLYVYCRFRSNSARMEANWANWFEVTKAATSVMGVLAMNWVRASSPSCHILITSLLVLNMMEAVVRDLQAGWGHATNAVCGLILLGLLPYQTVKRWSTQTDSLFLFEISDPWIGLYSSWNAAFSYGLDYSLSTRVILLTAVVVSHVVVQVPAAWLSARCLSLVLNMVLRATRTTYLYTPDCSSLTSTTPRHQPTVRFVWSAVNFGCACVLWYLKRV